MFIGSRLALQIQNSINRNGLLLVVVDVGGCCCWFMFLVVVAGGGGGKVTLQSAFAVINVNGYSFISR